MSSQQIGSAVSIIIFTLLSGWGDSQGFLHAANIWSEGKLIWVEVIKSALGFGLGMVMFWISIRFLQEFKIISPEIQTIGWFTVTIVGVALLSGKFLHWRHIDQIIGVAILFGIVWLLVRTTG
jgi:divalent metal cation (Fe/Co/Zn/Cd) transporter